MDCGTTSTPLGDTLELTGVTGAPYKHPEVRKRMPAPHSRDRIDLDGASREKRSWKDTSVLKIIEGDTVAGFGRVVSAVEFIPRFADRDLESRWQVRLTNVDGVWRDYGGHERLFAFSRDQDEPQ